MPRQFRQCNFCSNNSTQNPTATIFTVNDHIRSSLGLAQTSPSFVCEDHFDIEDIKEHGQVKRLRECAIPVHFPRLHSVSQDHNYVLTAPLDLEPDIPEPVVEETLRCDYHDDLEELQELDPSEPDSQVDQDTPTLSQNLPSSGSCYMPSQSSTASANDEPASQPNENDGCILEGKMLIVSWSSVLLMLSICRREGCGSQVLPDNMDVTKRGAAVSVKMTCNEGHREAWSSCNNVGEGKWSMPIVNLYIILYNFMTGMNFDQLKAFFDGIGIVSISANTYYRHLKSLVYPVIWTYWLMQQSQNIAEVMVTGCMLRLRDFE